MGGSGRNLHLSEEKEPMESAVYSIFCHNKPGGYFTDLALVLYMQNGQVADFLSSILRLEEYHSHYSPYMMKQITFFLIFSCSF